MAEYIEREALLEKLHEIGGCGAEPDTWADGYDKAIDVAYGLVLRTPAANVAPARHGAWKKSSDDYCGLNIIKCSLCHEEWCFEVDDDVVDLNYNYCPNCGARMDGGDGNATD